MEDKTTPGSQLTMEQLAQRLEMDTDDASEKLSQLKQLLALLANG